MRCAICGENVPERRPWEVSFYICSEKCQQEFDRRVEEIFRRRYSRLIGKSLILDPSVGDEYEIARICAKMRIESELSRHVRLENLRKNMNELGLPTEFAEHIMILVERESGSNSTDVEIAGSLWRVYYSGEIEQTNGYGYYWKRLANGWLEVRADNYPPDFIPDEKMRFPAFGDIAGAAALSIVEHGPDALKKISPPEE